MNFTKMQGLGNDFMVIEWPEGRAQPAADEVRRLSDRRHGVGFDQLLTVTRLAQGGSAARYRVFNAEGGEVEQCGNGVRCIASWLAPSMPDLQTVNGATGEAAGSSMVLESTGRPIEARLLADGRVRVNLGAPDFRPAALPLDVPAEAPEYAVDLGGRTIRFGAVSMGNPHMVLPVDSAVDAPVGILGPELTVHPLFPKGVNVGFMEIVDTGRIRLRVHERGVGETLACGTGAAAAVAVGRLWQRLGESVIVELPGGQLEVQWQGPGQPLWQTGAATRVYEGQIEL